MTWRRVFQRHARLLQNLARNVIGVADDNSTGIDQFETAAFVRGVRREMRSRVIPGSSPTMDRRCPVIRLNKVDLPTFGRPTITTVGVSFGMCFHDISVARKHGAFDTTDPAAESRKAVRQFFRSGGMLAAKHPAFERRPGQMEMAEAVDDALAENRKLIVEAGTGTGKTLAYLVPALLSGRRIVISTGTKALQEQLFFRDIPFLESVFDRPLRVCYMKGRNNYACRQKIYESEDTPVLSGFEEVADFQIIREWEKTTEMGDRAEIRTLPEDSTAWAKIDARSELCAGSKCSQFDRCFITLMHQRAAEADIIIVNHHLFFADLAVRRDEMAAHSARLQCRDLRRSPRDRRYCRPVFRLRGEQLPRAGTAPRHRRDVAGAQVRV